MPLTVRSFRTNDTNWQRDRQAHTPRKTYSRAASTVAADTQRPKLSAWGALFASAQETYTRERQMTTEERMEQELRKLTDDHKQHEREFMSGTPLTSPQPLQPLTADSLAVLDQQDPQNERHRPEDVVIETEAMVPSFSYAVAELAKSLEESRKALKKATTEKEQLKRENDELRKERQLRQDLEVKLRKFEDWVSPQVHANLRIGWEEWANAAEKTVDTLQAKLDKANSENESLSTTLKLRNNMISKLEERVKSFQGYTTPHERKVLDATIDMLNNNLIVVEAEKENCPTCAHGPHQATPKATRKTTRTGLREQKTIS